MEIVEILKNVGIILSFVATTAIPFIVALIKAVKARKAAKTEAEKEKANSELRDLAKDLIAKAEAEYKEYNAFLKARGQSAGKEKKNSVMTDLKAYAIEKGYAFDADTWSETIDSLVEFTRAVNSTAKK